MKNFDVGVVKYKKFFNLRAEKFHFTKYKKTFWRKYQKLFFREHFFYFSSLDLKMHQVSPYYFTPDATKQAQKVIFIRKIKVTTHPQLVFNNNPVHENSTQKHLKMFLNFKLNFQKYFENILSKVNKNIRLLHYYKTVSLDHHY